MLYQFRIVTILQSNNNEISNRFLTPKNWIEFENQILSSNHYENIINRSEIVD